MVVRAGYIRATKDRRQHWHRDRPLTHKTQGKALCVFVPWHVDIPADGSRGSYLPLSREGLPMPWYEYPLDMYVGDLVVFTSELIHCGAAVPVGLAAGTPRVVAFISLANYNLHYNNTVPIPPPACAYAEAQIPTSTEKCGRKGCRKKVAQPLPICFMRQKVPLCQIHVPNLGDTGGHQKAEARGTGRIEAHAREMGGREGPVQQVPLYFGEAQVKNVCLL